MSLPVFCALVMLAQSPDDATRASGETEIQRDPWMQFQNLLVGTRVHITLKDGSEIEGEFQGSTNETVSLKKIRAASGRNTGRDATEPGATTTVRRDAVATMRAPAWAQPAAHRLDDKFLYEVVDLGLGRTPSGFRRVYSGAASRLAIRSDGPAFWLAVRVTDLLREFRTGRGSRFPLFLQEGSARDDRGNRYSVRRVQVVHPVYADDERGGWWPGTFSVELLYIPISELKDGINELEVTLFESESTGGQRTRYVFSIRNPQSLKRDFRNRDFNYEKPATAPETLPVEARTFTSTRR